MTSKIRLFGSLVLIAFLGTLQSGCEKSESLSQSQPEHEWTPEDGLMLNSQQKWKVDDHTRNSLSRMRVLVEKTSQDELGKAMAGEISALFEGWREQVEAVRV